MKDQIHKLLREVLFCIGFCALIAIWVALLLRTTLFGEIKAYMFRLFVLEAIFCILILTVVLILSANDKQVLGLDLSSTVLCIGLSAFFMALFFSLGPAVAERSYTVFTLADMADHADVSYTEDELKDRFIDVYIEEFEENKRRVEEQLSIGNIEYTDDGYHITEKGKKLIWLFRLVETIFPATNESSIYPNGHVGINS